MTPGEKSDPVEKERLDRNLEEMLRELRLAIPGVTVLLGFLLALPFQTRFGEVTAFQEAVYFACLLLTAASVLLLVAPTAYHRLTFRHQMKAHLVPLGNRLAILGLVALALSVTGVVVLITDFLYGPLTTAIIGGTCGLLFAVLWFALPISARIEEE
ncbi:MAG: DUF6328 family protein [Solirubrobacterales bacterium]